MPSVPTTARILGVVSSSSRARRITIVGLGPGDPGHLTCAARDVLADAGEIWVRTSAHPALEALPQQSGVRSCDDLYAAEATFERVYEAIAERLVAAAQTGEVVYAVPGDPSVGESSVGKILELAGESAIAVTLLPGVSFIEPTLALLGWDALDGVQLGDAMELGRQLYPSLDPDRPALIAQVYSRLIASDLKLTLLSQYPPRHPVYVVGRAGSASSTVECLALEELDRVADFDDQTCLAVSPLPDAGSLLSLAELVARLRAPDGCPWDREQTHESLRPFLLEEAYEALAALDSGDARALAEELGDLLLQIVLHAQVAVEAGEFSLPEVVGSIHDKIVRRHPHVFGSASAATAADVRVAWDALKIEERAEKGETDPFEGVPTELPALARAQLVQRKAEGAGVGEEIDVARALEAIGEEPAGEEADAREVGAALWATVAVARSRGVDAETALRDAINRFVASAK